jgi:hypothetical protein
LKVSGLFQKRILSKQNPEQWGSTKATRHCCC